MAVASPVAVDTEAVVAAETVIWAGFAAVEFVGTVSAVGVAVTSPFSGKSLSYLYHIQVIDFFLQITSFFLHIAFTIGLK